ncbi:MAG: transglutaminase family protein [Burkholderiales bacterium]|nr:transglutaminase family protein [Burkholderiales bacterium]
MSSDAILGTVLSVEHETVYRYAQPVDQAQHMACLRPLSDAGQVLQQFDLRVLPTPATQQSRVDAHGNNRTYLALHAAHRELSVVARSEVWVADRYEGLDPCQGATCADVRELLTYRAHAPFLPASEFLYASPYVPCLEPLREYAAPSLLDGRPLAESAIELMQRIHEDFDYAPASTDISTPILDVFIERQGVCQDFAHLMLGCLRASGLAARYVSGYLLTRPPEGQAPLIGADASHAWVSVWVPGLGQGRAGDWLDLDPTNACLPGQHHVRVAHGRDFGDVTPLRGVIRSGGEHTFLVRVTTTLIKTDAQAGTGVA